MFASGYFFVVSLCAGLEHRVSYCHTGSGRLEQDPLSAGVPAYVMQEEFSRYQVCMRLYPCQ